MEVIIITHSLSLTADRHEVKQMVERHDGLPRIQRYSHHYNTVNECDQC